MPTKTTTEAMETTQEHMLSAVRQSQDAIVRAVSVWSEAVSKAVPELPATSFAKDLPTPAEIVDSSFKFAERLLAAQHEFAKEVLAAAAPVIKKTTAANGSKSAPKA